MFFSALFAVVLSAPGHANEPCHELPKSGPLLVGKANELTFIGGPETAEGICAIFPNEASTPRQLPQGSYRLLPGSRVIDWRGIWQQGNHSTISIVATEELMGVIGETEHGLDRGAPAIGSFEVSLDVPYEWRTELVFAIVDGEAAPLESASFTDCTIRLRRAGLWLVVDDDGRCGGAGVSFAGLYERLPGR